MYLQIKITLFSENPQINKEIIVSLQTIQAGDPLNLQIETTGHPAPSVTWRLNDEDIDDEKITTKVEGRESSLMTAGIERKHGGRYTATAENIAGRDQIDIDVNVTGKN